MRSNYRKFGFQSKLEIIKLDLVTYKVQLHFQNHKDPLVIHFDKPARKFYFSLIALVVVEMKNLDKPEFIYIRKHEKTLKLLDNSLAGPYASRTAKGMWDKIRKAWRHRLPDLETAAFFKILDRDLIKPYEKGGKYRYDCLDYESDTWRNLFDYDENNPWRFKLAIDSASISLNDISVILGDLRDNSAWKEFVKRLSMQPKIETASVENMAYPLPDKPSIAVLPFVNMSGDPDQEHIGDSITESIITALSYIPEMFVIARTSISVYKGKAVKVKQVSEELGVRYVLEGSVMKAGNRIRVTAQLIDAISGHHLWTDRYDREIKDFFDLLDEIAKKVAIELQVKLTEGEVARISHKTKNFEAWAYATTAYSLEKRFTKESFVKAKELCEKAVKLDPKYGFAWGVLGAAHFADALFGWVESRDKSFKLAVEYTDKSLKLDETLSCATAIKGLLHMRQGQFEQAIAVGRRAIALGPSHDVSYGHLSRTMQYSGRFKEPITLVKKAMRLNPHYPAWYLDVLTVCYFMEERYEESIEAGKRFLERAQKGEFPPLYAHLGLSAAYYGLGRNEEAKAHAAEVIGINPKFSLESYAKTVPYKNKTDKDRFIGALQKAGLK
jgi:TolB-like protein